MALCGAIKPVHAQAPLHGLDNLGDLDSTLYLCAAGAKTESIVILPTGNWSVEYAFLYVQAPASMSTFDLYVDVRTGATTTGSVLETVQYTPTLPTSMSQVTIDFSPFLEYDTLETFTLTFRLEGAAACDASHRVYLQGSTDDVQTTQYRIEDNTERPDDDGVRAILYGDASVSSWINYTTSTDPYGYFDAYSSSSYGFTDADFGWFGNAMVDVLKYMFVGPLENINDWFQLQLQNTRYRSPQGYITRAQELWENSLYDSFESASTTPLTVDILGRTKTVFAADPEATTGIDFDEWRTVSTYVWYLIALSYFIRRSSDFVDNLNI